MILDVLWVYLTEPGMLLVAAEPFDEGAFTLVAEFLIGGHCSNLIIADYQLTSSVDIKKKPLKIQRVSS